jgi:hypothetical protein
MPFIKLLKRMITGGSSTARPSHPVLDASSDGLPNLEGQTFSVVIDGEEYEWDIGPLHKRAEAGEFKLERFEIPTKFAQSWYWGDTSLEDHVERTLKADFNYPILVWDGQIVDGSHRCCLALATGMTHIKAYRIINMPPYDRCYPAKSTNRAPEGLSHAQVVRQVNGYIFTPLPYKVQ